MDSAVLRFSSVSLRCLQTVQPYADKTAVRVHARTGLSEEGFAQHPAKAVRHVDALLDRGEPAALCSHGPVLPGLIDRLGRLVPDNQARGQWMAEELYTAADSRMSKGEVLVCHLTGRGVSARIVGVERIDT